MFPMQKSHVFPLLLQFPRLFDELIQGVEAILAAGHMGVIVQLADSCAESGQKQDEMIKSLLNVSGAIPSFEFETFYFLSSSDDAQMFEPQAFHCAEPNSRQVCCLPLFMSLLTYEVYYHSDTAGGDAQTEVKTEIESNHFCWSFSRFNILKLL